jgi:ATP-dependent Clp protease protease subunit
MTEKAKKQVSLRLDEERRDALLHRNILLLTSEIESHDEEESASDKFYRDLTYLATEHNHKGPILVILNSPGGDIYRGLAIYDTIRMFVESGIEINVLGNGLVASMATIILQAGKRRFASQNAQFLVHQVSDVTLFSIEEVNQAEERTAEHRRINNIVMNVIAEKVGMPLDELLEISHKKDYWLGAQNALEFGVNGLIDEITTKFPLSRE